MITKEEIKKKYPEVTNEELHELTQEEFNTCTIRFLEGLLITLKKDMQEMYKTKKDWKATQEDFDYVMGEFREQKNFIEHQHKLRVLEQHYLREGFNPPFMYQQNDNLYYGDPR